ncbi:hypothetical protein ANO14919_074080 [Xylariales sp. No.14919]|nr:hypothetical protein ANO14919_074080 [Xylariales sp. No.14919]
MPLTTPSVFPPASDAFVKFASRRSVVHSTKGIVACTQPLAAKCGIQVLDAGGNCVDAAVAVGTSMPETPCARHTRLSILSQHATQDPLVSRRCSIA